MTNTIRWAQKIKSSTLAYLYYSYDFLSDSTEASR